VQQLRHRQLAARGAQDARTRVEGPHRSLRARSLIRRRQVALVQNDRVRALHLRGYQLRYRPLVPLLRTQAARLQRVAAAQRAQQPAGVHHRQQAVQRRVSGQAAAAAADGGERGGHGQRVRDARRLHQQVIEPAGAS